VEGITTLTRSTKAWSADQFNGAYIWIYKGTGAGQIRTISATAATRITVSTKWSTNPDNTSYYAIGGGATLTGTASHHLYIDGKQVYCYGFKHTGATGRDIEYRNHASGYSFYNYSTGVEFCRSQAYSEVRAYYNYMDTTTCGFFINQGSLWPRACVFDGMTTGLDIMRGGIAHMVVGGNKNYFLGCTKGIYLRDGGACVAASGQVFSGCTTDIDPATSATVPNWWS